MSEEIALSVKNIKKTFQIPHEKVDSMREYFMSMFKKKTYEEFEALSDISFDVKKGEFFGIIGRNGAGKSTLLKILAGIYEVDQGDILINGLIAPFLELGIGFNPELSGRDNIYLNAAVLGMTRKEIDKKFDEIVAFAELERFIDQQLKNYSSGMQVRLAFSVSIHANRDILLMDEVLAVGDSRFQKKCMKTFEQYRALGKTVILVTHDIGAVQKYCDRAMYIDRGSVASIGSVEKVCEEYNRTLFSGDEKSNNLSEIHQSAPSKEISVHPEYINPSSIAITKIMIGDAKYGSEVHYMTGDNVTVRVHFFECGKKISGLNFGIAIIDKDGEKIFGINTFDTPADTDRASARGYFEVTFKNVRLGSGYYAIRATISGTLRENMLASAESREGFFLERNSRCDGIVDLEHEWV